MKNKKSLKSPAIRIDKSLDKYHEIEQSSEKTKMAIEKLAKMGLPKVEHQKKKS